MYNNIQAQFCTLEESGLWAVWKLKRKSVSITNKFAMLLTQHYQKMGRNSTRPVLNYFSYKATVRPATETGCQADLNLIITSNTLE